MNTQIIQEKKYKKKNKHAFTLVELIIVITILAILATISFVTFEKYFSNARDSVRLTDMKGIYDAITVYTVKTGETPLPDSDKIEVKNGTSILTYQGYAGETVFTLIGLHKGGIDPKDNKNYVYTTDAPRRKVQLMGYLEAGENIKVFGYKTFITQAFADTNDLKNRYIYVYGDTLGILTDAQKNPLQDVISASSINLLDEAQIPIGTTTYFGGELYDGGKSLATGSTLVNQIVTTQNITPPASPSGSSCVLGSTFVLGNCSL